MRARLVLLAVAAVLLAATPPLNYCPSYNDLIANQSGNFTWSGTPPTASPSLVTYARYKALVVNTTAPPCPAGIPDNEEVTWNVVISCAQNHIASQQSESVSGNYSTVYYTATFNSTSELYSCHGPKGTDAYYGTPITLPAGTVAPSSSTPLRLNLTSISYSGSTSLQVVLKDPSGAQRGSWSSSTGTLDTGNYTGAGGAGAWTWTITQTGGSDGACDSNDGVTQYGGTQVSWSGTATFYQ